VSGALKFSLLSATSFFATFAAIVGPGQPAAFAAAISVGLVGSIDWTGKASDTVPTVPPGVAAGAKPDEDFASSAGGATQLGAVGKARATAQAAVAPLIGTTGDGSLPGEKPGGTVFVAVGSQIGFADGSDLTVGASGSPGISASTLSGSRTATITVASGAKLSRAGSGRVSFVASAHSDPAKPAAGDSPERAQPDTGYHYAPLVISTDKTNLMAASFSDDVTGAVRIGGPVPPSKIHGSVATFDHRLIEQVQTIIGSHDDTASDGTKLFLSASVSANPLADATRYLAAVIDPMSANSIAQAVEGVRVAVSNGGDGTTVYNSLEGKIPANGGPLNNLLALP
jgi:hypothetical protein